MADVKAGLVAGQLTEGFHCFRLWGYPRYCNNNNFHQDLGDVEEDHDEKATWFEIIVDSHQPPGIMLGHQVKVGFNALKIVVCIITKTYLTIKRRSFRFRYWGCQMSSLLGWTLCMFLAQFAHFSFHIHFLVAKLWKLDKCWDLEVFSLLCLVWVLWVVIEWESNHLEISLWKMKSMKI